jgi:uncharacterized membrane protein
LSGGRRPDDGDRIVLDDLGRYCRRTIAAPFGWIDWSTIPRGTRAKAIGLWHGVGNTIVMLLFLGSWFLRSDLPEHPELAAFVLSFTGAGLALLTGWLGGELVDRLGVGVDDGAHPNAPSSLSRRPAR